MVSEEQKESPRVQKQTNPVDNIQNMESLFSPGFKSVAAMAGWDEESILIASFIVEDTPERQLQQKRLPDLHFKTPPSTNSRRKRRDQKKSPISIPLAVLNFDGEEQPATREIEKRNLEPKIVVDEENKENSDVSCSNSALPCMDKLREELSCAICLEICFEPSTTSCGHSFCKRCLRSAADKCGKKCPKCRQLIGNSRSCTVNTVLWNTIQLLFPQEVDARKASSDLMKSQEKQQLAGRRSSNDLICKSTRSSNRERSMRKRGMLSQDEAFRTSNRDASTSGEDMWSRDEDTPLAQRLQRREAIERLISSREARGRRRRGGYRAKMGMLH